MPLTFSVDQQNHVILTAAVGEIHLADVLAHLAHEAAEDGLGYPELVDATAADVRLSSSDIRRIVQELRELSSRQPLGLTVIVVSNDFAFGMMRMLSILCDEACPIEVFRSMNEARARLGLGAQA